MAFPVDIEVPDDPIVAARQHFMQYDPSLELGLLLVAATFGIAAYLPEEPDLTGAAVLSGALLLGGALFLVGALKQASYETLRSTIDRYAVIFGVSITVLIIDIYLTASIDTANSQAILDLAATRLDVLVLFSVAAGTLFGGITLIILGGTRYVFAKAKAAIAGAVLDR